MKRKLIPDIKDPIGKYWSQPKQEDFLYIEPEDVIVMSELVLESIKEYSRSIPSGVYEGKMWRSWSGKCWQLCWYDEKDPNDERYILIKRKDIALF